VSSNNKQTGSDTHRFGWRKWPHDVDSSQMITACDSQLVPPQKRLSHRSRTFRLSIARIGTFRNAILHWG